MPSNNRPTVASLAAEVSTLMEGQAAILAALQGLQAPSAATLAAAESVESPKGKGKGSRRNKPQGTAPMLAAGSSFEYLKGGKGKRKRWTTYNVIGAEDGKMLAMVAGSDSGFVSRWDPARFAGKPPYLRNVKPA